MDEMEDLCLENQKEELILTLPLLCAVHFQCDGLLSPVQ